MAHKPLVHMSSVQIDWVTVKNILKPINAVAAETYKWIEMKAGQTMHVLYKRLSDNSAQLNALTDATEIANLIFNHFYGISDMPDEIRYQTETLIKVDIARGGTFSVVRCMASSSLLLPMPLEEKMKVLFNYLDLNGDGYVDEKELHDGLSGFFLGIFHTLEAVLVPGAAVKAGIVNVNLDEIKKAIDLLKAVYTEEKINHIKNKCLEEASANKNGKISYAEWVAWFPTGVPDAFGSAKAIFDP